MLYLTMILLIGALAGLAYWQHLQEKEWLENWFRHNQHAHKAAPENTVNEPTGTAEQAEAENVGTTDHSADNTAAGCHSNTTAIAVHQVCHEPARCCRAHAHANTPIINTLRSAGTSNPASPA